MNQMLEAAQMSKEAAAKVSEEQAATQKAATQQSGSLSWVNCAEDSIPGRFYKCKQKWENIKGGGGRMCHFLNQK